MLTFIGIICAILILDIIVLAHEVRPSGYGKTQ